MTGSWDDYLRSFEYDNFAQRPLKRVMTGPSRRRKSDWLEEAVFRKRSFFGVRSISDGDDRVKFVGRPYLGLLKMMSVLTVEPWLSSCLKRCLHFVGGSARSSQAVPYGCRGDRIYSGNGWTLRQGDGVDMTRCLLPRSSDV